MSNPISAEHCTYKVLSSKIELRLRKAELGTRWEELEHCADPPPVKTVEHNKTKNWDKMAKDLVEEETKEIESAGGDAALQQMFKVGTILSIYSKSERDLFRKFTRTRPKKPSER